MGRYPGNEEEGKLLGEPVGTRRKRAGRYPESVEEGKLPESWRVQGEKERAGTRKQTGWGRLCKLTGCRE